jgi:hypothetical protein
MIDLIDILTGKLDKTFTGTYYPRLPRIPQDFGEPFDYEIVDPQERHYQMIFGNVEGSDTATLTIKTNDPLSYKVNGYISTEDGGFYVIESIREDRGKASKEASRYFARVPGVEWVLRLISHDNPMQLK